MADELGFAVIGAGMVGPQHAESIARLSGARLVMVCDRVEERARSLAERFDTAWTVEVDEVAANPAVDVVSICLPTTLHLPTGRTLARAGKHIVMEKPLESTVARGRELLEALAGAGVTLAPIFNRRFIPGNAAVQAAIRDGRLGDMIVADMYFKNYRSDAYYAGSGWRGTWEHEGGAALINQGIHGVDLLRWIAGDVQRVCAQVGTFQRDIQAEDTCQALLQFTSGGFGVLECTTSVTPAQPDRLEFHGSRGTIRLERDRIVQWEVDGLPRPEAADPAGEPDQTERPGSHLPQLRDIIDAIHDGRPPAVTAEDGLAALAIVEAIYLSARAGRWVDVESVGSQTDV